MKNRKSLLYESPVLWGEVIYILFLIPQHGVSSEGAYNLKAYKKIERYTFGYNEDPSGKSAFGIKLTPLSPSKENFENKVEGSFFITTYTYGEENEFKEDFELITFALKD